MSVVSDGSYGVPEGLVSSFPVTISDARDCDPLSRAFLHACVQQGTFENEDYNAERFEGASWLQYNTRGGKRCSAAPRGSAASVLTPSTCGHLVVCMPRRAPRRS